jgi:cytoskeleton protein RodZ
MMDKLPNNEIAVSFPDALPMKSAGKMLSEARILQGLSVADVAGRIKFAPRQVEALEADNYEQLPELAFVRGFVRSYARLLHLEETEILKALPQSTKQTAPLMSPAEVPFPTAQSARRINILWLSAALGLAVILGIGVLFIHDKPENKKVMVAQQVENMPSSVQPLVASAVEVASSVARTAVAEVPATNEHSATKIISKMNVAQTKMHNAPIHFVFNTESWVDLKDKDGKTLLKQVNAAGSEQWVSGNPPFSLVIGNASGVRLYYENEEVDLKDFTEVEVARLMLE